MTLQEQIRANRVRTVVVMFGFFVLIAAIALALSYAYQPDLLFFVGIIGIVYGLVSYFASGKIIATAAGARRVKKADEPELFRAVENAAIAAGLDRTPDVYVVDDPSPNAFAAGRTPKVAYVCATRGLLDLMNARELDGVMAHEISHVRNRDVRLMSIATVLAGVIVLITDMILRMTIWGGMGRRNNQNAAGGLGLIIALAAAILAPISAALLQMALSRRREYLADATAVELTGDAQGLASALYKLGRDQRPLAHATRATAHLYIESPLRDQPALRSSIGGMFDTHPPLQKRIWKLCEMGGLAPESYELGLADPEAKLIYDK